MLDVASPLRVVQAANDWCMTGKVVACRDNESTGEGPYDPGAPAEIAVDFNTSDHVEKYRYRRASKSRTPVERVSRRRLVGGMASVSLLAPV